MNSIEALTKIVDELEHRIAELEGNRLDKGKLKAYIDTKMGVSKRTGSAFTPPTEAEVQEYVKEIQYSWKEKYSAAWFVDKYAQGGWKLGNGNPMKDWKATVRLWYIEPYVQSKGTSKVSYCASSGMPKDKCQCKYCRKAE